MLCRVASAGKLLALNTITTKEYNRDFIFFPHCGKKNTSQLYFGSFTKQVAKFPLLVSFQVRWLPREDQGFGLSFSCCLYVSHGILIQASFLNDFYS